MSLAFGFRNLNGYWLPRIIQSPYATDSVSDTDNLYQKSATIRYSTFHNYPCDLDLYQLADAGFIYLGVGTRVQCVHCHIILEGFLSQDDPEEIHSLIVPFCPYFTQK